MNQFYEVEGQKYEVGEHKLSDFLLDFPNALRVEADVEEEKEVVEKASEAAVVSATAVETDCESLPTEAERVACREAKAAKKDVVDPEQFEGAIPISIWNKAQQQQSLPIEGSDRVVDLKMDAESQLVYQLNRRHIDDGFSFSQDIGGMDAIKMQHHDENGELIDERTVLLRGDSHETSMGNLTSVMGYSDYLDFIAGTKDSVAADKEATDRANTNAETFMLSNDKAIDKRRNELMSVIRAEGGPYSEEELQAKLNVYEESLEKSRTGGFLSKKRGEDWKETPKQFYERITPVEGTISLFRKSGVGREAVDEPTLTIAGISRRFTSSDADPSGHYEYYREGQPNFAATKEERDLFYTHKFHHEQRVASDVITDSLLDIDGEIEKLSVAEKNIYGGSAVAGEGKVFHEGQEAALIDQRKKIGENIKEGDSEISRSIRSRLAAGDNASADAILEREIDNQLDLHTQTEADALNYVQSQNDIIDSALLERWEEGLADGTFQEGESTDPDIVDSFEDFKNLPQNEDLFGKIYNDSQKEFYVENQRGFDEELKTLFAPNEDGTPNDFIVQATTEAQDAHREEYEAVRAAAEKELLEKFRKKYDNITGPIQHVEQRRLAKEIQNGEFVGTEEEINAEYERRVLAKYENHARLKSVSERHEKALNKALQPVNDKINSTYQDLIKKAVEPIEEEYGALALANHEKANKEFISLWQGTEERLIPKEEYRTIFNRLNDQGFGAYNAKNKRAAILLEWQSLESALRLGGDIDEAGIAKRKKEYFYSMWEQLAYDKEGKETAFNSRMAVVSTMDELEKAGKEREASGESIDYSHEFFPAIAEGWDKMTGITWWDYLDGAEKKAYKEGQDALAQTENMSASGTKNFFMGMGSTNVIDWVPIVDDILDLGDSVYINGLVKKQVAHQKNDKNPPLTKAETNLLLMRKYKEMAINRAGELSNAWAAGNGMPSSVKLMGEMALMYATAGSSSIFTRGLLMGAKRKLVQKGISKAITRGDYAKLFARGSFRVKPPSAFTSKTLDILTTSFITSLAGTPRVVSETYKGMTPEMEFAYSQEGDEWIQSIMAHESNEGGSWGKKLTQEFHKNWVEVFTEKFGAHIPGMKNSLVGKLTPKEWEDISLRMMLGRYLRKKGIKPGGEKALTKFKQMVGFDGLLAEVAEEFLAQPPQNLIDGNDMFSGMDQDFVEQTLIATGAMTLAFGGLGLSGNVISKMNGNHDPYYWVNGTSYATAQQAQDAVKKLKVEGKLTADTQIEISYDADALTAVNDIVKGTPMENRVETTEVGLEVTDVAAATEIEAINSLSQEDRILVQENKARLEEIKAEQQENTEREKKLNESGKPVAENKGEKQKLRTELIASQAEARELESKNNKLLAPIIAKITANRTEKGYKKMVQRVRNFAKMLDPNLTVVEVQTQEEVGAYVLVSKKNEILKPHGIKVSINKKGKETYTDTKTGKTITKAEILKRDIDLDSINAESDTYLKSQGDLSQVHGTIFDLNDGTEIILLNKTASIELGAGNVAAHEWLHRVLNKTFLNNPQTALAVGRSLDKYLRDLNPKGIANSNLRARINNYQKTQGEIVSAEETLNLFSDAIANGEITFNENVFTKVGDVIRRSFRAMGVKVSFNNAQDVFNFVRDYNRTMESTNKNAKMPLGLRRTMAEGANLGGEIKYKSDRYETLLEEIGFQTPKAAVVKKSSDVSSLIDKYDGNHKKMIRKGLGVMPNGEVLQRNPRTGDYDLRQSEFGQEIMPIVEATTKRLFDSIPANIASNAGVTRQSFQNDLIQEAATLVTNEYDPNLQKVDAFISNRLNLRANSLAERLGIPSAEEGNVVRIDQQVEGSRQFDIAADDTSMDAFDEQDLSLRGRDKQGFDEPQEYSKTVNLDTKSQDEIKTAVSDAAVNINGLDYKGVKKLTTGNNAPLSKVLDITAAQFGVDPKRIIKPADLNGKQRTSAQQYIKDNTQALIDMLPEGETRSGVATGVANTKLGGFYVKGERGSFAGGATAAGKPTQTKRSDISKQEFRETFGIKPDGTFVNNKKHDGAIKALVNQAAIITANQAIRKNALETGSHSEASVALLGDGRSQVMFSRDVKPENQEAYNENYPALIKEIGNVNMRDIESIELATQRTFGDKGLSTSEINKIAKSIYNQTIEYDRIKSEHTTGMGARRVEMPDTLMQFLEKNFQSEQLELGIAKALGFEGGLPRDSEGKVIPVGAHYFDLDRVITGREAVVILGNKLIAPVKDGGMGMKPAAVAEFLLSHYSGMYVGASQIADGRFKVNHDTGEVYLDPEWDIRNDGSPGNKWRDRNGKLQREGGKLIHRQNRKQLFVNKQDFVSKLRKIKGLEGLAQESGYQVGHYYVGSERLNTTLLSESSAAFVSEKGSKFNEREAQAKKAREAVEVILDMYFEKVDQGVYDYADLAMVLTSLGSGMQAPMRRAANAEYTMMGIEDVIKNRPKGKNGKPVPIGSITEYEHSIPQEEMALRVLDSYMRNGVLDPEVWDGYKVAVISNAMNTVLNENGYRRRSPVDGKPRYFNQRTFRHPDIHPLRSHDPAKKGTEAEFVGKNFVEAGRAMGKRGKVSQSDLIAMQNAYRNIRLSKGITESKGITVLDFDDTLATTKSGVGARIPNPDGTPKPGRKVIFMAGGAGSGKGNVISKLGLEKAGYKTVNSDISLEWLKKNHGLPENQTDYTAEQRSQLSKLTWEARQIAKRKQGKFAGKGDGIVVDGTGGSVKVMQAQVQAFKDKGYDVSMVFVETSLEVAQQRNAARKERSLKEFILNKNHEQVQGNKEAFKELFGENFNEISTDNIGLKDALPKKFKDKVDSFTNSYENRRLDAEEFAREGVEIKKMGGEFDFSEFDTVKEGKPGPLFDKAMKLAGKFGTDNMFILTARGSESAKAIKEFLDAQGLNIPLENITGLGKSEASAKADWIAEKIKEGYNDFYFADDAIQNVDAVRDMLNQHDVKSKVQQAKLRFSKSAPARFSDMIDSSIAGETIYAPSVEVKAAIAGIYPDGYSKIRFSRAHRGEYESRLLKKNPNIKTAKEAAAHVDELFKWLDSPSFHLDASSPIYAAKHKSKFEKLALHYMVHNKLRLPEDGYKVIAAEKLAKANKVDPFSFKNPNEIIEQFSGKINKKNPNPDQHLKENDNIGAFSNKRELENGITIYDVNNGYPGMFAVRNMVNEHFGRKSNPWCIIQGINGEVTPVGKGYWDQYGTKQIIFKDGKLIGMRTESLETALTDAGDIEFWSRENVKYDEIPGNNYVDGQGRKIRGSFDVDTGKKLETVYGATKGSIESGKIEVWDMYTPAPNQQRAGYDASGNYLGFVPVLPTLFLNTVERYKNGKLHGISEEHTNPVELETGSYASSIITIKEYDNGKFVGSRVDYGDGRGLLPMQYTDRGPGEAGPHAIQFSMEGKSGDLDLDIILEETKDVGRHKTFSAAKARQRGRNKGRFKFFLPPSAEDFAGLIYAFLGKGKQGERQHAWFKENLFDPFAKGIRLLKAVRQNSANGLKVLRKNTPGIKSLLKKKVPGIEFNGEQAVRVYNWIKAGYEVPGLSQKDKTKLVDTVESNETLKSYANGVSVIANESGGFTAPGNNWLGGTIPSDINDSLREARGVFLQQWKENVDIIFSEANLNKIEAVYGTNFREALEDMLYRMETGSTRNKGKDRMLNNFTAWLHGSVGATMFLNMRSAILQQLSNINFINWHDNNPLKAAKAFANQKQYWTDFVMIFNSPWLKQRRSGIATDINAAELLNAMQGSRNPMKTAIAYLLQFGFTPTQIGDSLAIATGGATMYRNRVQTYLDKGMSKSEAENKAWEDMMEIAEATQQSTREDMISQQQASPLGKFILAFQNVTMQYNRLMKKATLDLINGRGDIKTNISKIAYYGVVQNMIFYSLQQALFTALFDDGDDDDDENKNRITEKKKKKLLNGMMDSVLRGSGMKGAVVATVKNVIIKWIEQDAKNDDGVYWTDPNHAYTIIEALNVSPPLGIKARKLYSATQTWQFNRDVIKHMDKTDIDNPMWDAAFSATEAATNVPLSRLYTKYQNVLEALSSENEVWQRVAMFMGWNKWSFGVQNQDVITAKKEVKEIKAEEKKVKADMKKVAKEVERNAENEVIEEGFLLDQEEEREEDKKDIKCAAVNRSGMRCGKKILAGQNYCTIHESAEQNTTGEKTQCTHIKDDGKRCKMKTSNASKKCYYHD